MKKKSCVLLPAAGRRTQVFHLIFTEPGKRTLARPYRRVAEFIDKDNGGFISAWEMKAFMATLFPGKCKKCFQKDKN